MKILTLCLSTDKGGLELYVKRCIEYYQTKNINYHNALCNGSFLAHQFPENLSPLNKPAFKPLPLITAYKLAKILEQQCPELMHIHHNKDLPIATLAKKLSRHKPRLFYSRHMKIHHDKHNIYHRWLYQSIDCFLGITKQVCQQARNLLPIEKSKIVLLYLGVPKKLNNPEKKSVFFVSENLKENMFTIAVIGRIEKAKGQHLTIEAISKLRKKNNPMQLVIIGHAMDKHYLQTLKQLVKAEKLTKLVRFIDFYPKPMRIMPCFDAIVLTTSGETFGLVLPEAMRSGTAVIGTNADGVKEIIDPYDTGLLFEPDNVNDLVEKLEFYYKNTLLRQSIAQNGKQKADNYFSEDRHFASLHAIYKKFIA